MLSFPSNEQKEELRASTSAHIYVQISTTIQKVKGAFKNIDSRTLFRSALYDTRTLHQLSNLSRSRIGRPSWRRMSNSKRRKVKSGNSQNGFASTDIIMSEGTLLSSNEQEEELRASPSMIARTAVYTKRNTIHTIWINTNLDQQHLNMDR